MDRKLYNIFEEVILENNLLTEDVSNDTINDAIINKYRVNITYDDGKGGPQGKRNLEVYAINEIDGYTYIRAFQLFGATRTETAVWKTFRRDRILTWEKTNFKFYNPVSDRDSSIPSYREDGKDKTLGAITHSADNYAEFDSKYRKTKY